MSIISFSLGLFLAYAGISALIGPRLGFTWAECMLASFLASVSALCCFGVFTHPIPAKYSWIMGFLTGGVVALVIILVYIVAGYSMVPMQPPSSNLSYLIVLILLGGPALSYLAFARRWQS